MLLLTMHLAGSVVVFCACDNTVIFCGGVLRSSCAYFHFRLVKKRTPNKWRSVEKSYSNTESCLSHDLYVPSPRDVVAIVVGL